MVRGNIRLWDQIDKDVAGKVWLTVCSLGVSGVEKKGIYVEAIREMKARNREGLKRREEYTFVQQ